MSSRHPLHVAATQSCLEARCHVQLCCCVSRRRPHLHFSWALVWIQWSGHTGAADRASLRFVCHLLVMLMLRHPPLLRAAGISDLRARVFLGQQCNRGVRLDMSRCIDASHHLLVRLRAMDLLEYDVSCDHCQGMTPVQPQQLRQQEGFQAGASRDNSSHCATLLPIQFQLVTHGNAREPYTSCPVRMQAHSTTIVSPAAAAAAASKKWRRLLFLAWEAPFDLFGQHQLHEMEQLAEQHTLQEQQQADTRDPNRAHLTTPVDVETGLTTSDLTGPSTAKGSRTAHQAHPSGPARAGEKQEQLHTAATQQLMQQQQQSSKKGQRQPKAQKPLKPDMLVLDLPWVYHWPKLVLWLLFEGCHITLAVGESLATNEREIHGKSCAS